MMNAVTAIKQQGGEILYGGQRLSGGKYPGDCYVTPCIAAVRNEFHIVQEETFAPILYIITYGKGRDVDSSRPPAAVDRDGSGSVRFTGEGTATAG